MPEITIKLEEELTGTLTTALKISKRAWENAGMDQGDSSAKRETAIAIMAIKIFEYVNAQQTN